MKHDLQAEMLISAEAKRLADRYNKDYLDCEDLMKITGLGKGNVPLWIDMISQQPMSASAKLLVLWHLQDGLTFKITGGKTNG